MRRLATFIASSTLVAGCSLIPDVDSFEGTPEFPRKSHSLLPEAPSPFSEEAGEWQFANGVITGEGPEQPVQFPHHTHVTTLKMQCEYCHQAARKSIHAGVPQTETCMNCHSQVKKAADAEAPSPEIAKVVAAYQAGEPLEWAKVHDLPDYVHFSHKRHVRAGVQCTECHGQIGLQGQVTTRTEIDEASGEEVEVRHIEDVMVRETTLQMGWCLGLPRRRTPPSNENYGEHADLRRAELKDCWTCHK